MNEEKAVAVDQQVYYRLIALWVVCEAVLGGMIHGMKLPISGLIVGSSAVICICLIGYYFPSKNSILKATIIVAVFKFMLSPHSPPAAYIAVLFQGVVGQIIFSQKKFFSLSCILLGILALVESAIQRIIVLLVLYGNSFWQAINEYLSRLTGEKGVTNYSLAFAAAYILLHAFVGVAVGLLANYLVKKINNTNYSNREYFIEGKETIKIQKKRKYKLKVLFIFLWLVLVFLLFQSLFKIGNPILPTSEVLLIFLRSLLILFTWILFINPLIKYFLNKWVKRQQVKSEKDIYQVGILIPSTQYLLIKSWELSAKEKGWRRISECCKIILINTFRKND